MSKKKRKEIIDELSKHQIDCPICDFPLALIVKSNFFAIQVDHVIPKSLGGIDDISNYRLAHKICNQIRGNKSPEWKLANLWQ